MILRAGHYKLKQHKVWLPVLIRVENSKDEDGRVADRPRLTLYVGGERHERPLYEEWGHRIFPASAAEYERLKQAHSPETVSSEFNLKSAPSLF